MTTLTTTCPDCGEVYDVQIWPYTEDNLHYIAVAYDYNELPQGYPSATDALDAAVDHLRTTTYHCIYTPEEIWP